MKKIILLIIILTINFIYSQKLPFNLAMKMDMKTAKIILSSNFTQASEINTNMLTFITDGKLLAGEETSFLLCLFHKNKLIRCFISFESKKDWYSIKSQYNNLNNILSKYKKEDNQFYFITPYDEGDGYEMQALRMNKAFISSSYSDVNMSINISIQEDYTRLIYEDTVLFNEYILEQESLQKNEL